MLSLTPIGVFRVLADHVAAVIQEFLVFPEEMDYQDIMVSMDHQEEMENRALKEKVAQQVHQANKVRQAHRDLKAPLAQDSNTVGKNVFGRISMTTKTMDS